MRIPVPIHFNQTFGENVHAAIQTLHANSVYHIYAKNLKAKLASTSTFPD